MTPQKQKNKKFSAQRPQASLQDRAASWLAAGPWRGAALLAVFTWLLWSRTLGFGLHYWDDSVYLFQDPRLDGLTLSHFWAVLSRPFFANYHPVTTLTYFFDRAVWGQWLPGYRLTHLLFYSAGVALTYEFFRRVLGDRPWALFGAALFSAHAVHVEPVAWLACRKDIVCLLFYAAALLAYERYAARADSAEENAGPWPWRDYLSVSLFTCLALGAKGYAVILPAAFLARDLCFSPRISRRHWLDKMPLLALAVWLGLMTVWAQDDSSALLKDMSVLGGLTFPGRLEVLLKIFALYAGRSLAPLYLNATYLVSSQGWYPGWVALLGLALFAALFAGFFLLRRRSPAAAYALALFGLPLATTMNTFFTLRIWMADRYLFLPTLGSCLLLALAGKALREKWPGRGGSGRPAKAAFAVLALYCGLTALRTNVWSSLVLLRSDSLRKNSNLLPGDGPVTAEEFLARAKGRQVSVAFLDSVGALAVAYEKEGNPGEAYALRGILKQAGQGGTGAASGALEAGRPLDAIALFTAVVEKDEWEAPEAAKGIGDAYSKMAQPENARRWYRRSFGLHKKRGLSGAPPLVGEMALEFNLKNYARALEILGHLQKEAPGDPRGYFFEGRALEELGRPGEAYKKYELTERLPDSAFRDTQLTPADVQRQLGSTAQKLGRMDEMRKHFSRSLRLNPNDPQRAAIEKILEYFKGAR